MRPYPTRSTRAAASLPESWASPFGRASGASTQGRPGAPRGSLAVSHTTTSTALNPIGSIAEIARRHGLWLHVDAAMAGSAMILPECRWMWAGVEGADSIVLNPHKWLGAAFDCSVYYVRDAEHLVRVMSTSPSYLRSADDGRVKNFRDWGLPLGRRFRALKLWFVIRNFGVDGLRSLIREHIRIARKLAEWIDDDPEFERMAEANFSTVVFRHCPPGMSATELDAHNARLVERVLATREVFLSHTRVRGKYALRIAIGNIHTTEEHVRHALELVREAARAEA